VHILNLVIQETHFRDDRKPSSVGGLDEAPLKPLDFGRYRGERLLNMYRKLTSAIGRLFLVAFEFSQLRAQVFDSAAGRPS